jgi:hypothetical protein
MAEDSGTKHLRYEFRLQDGTVREFELVLRLPDFQLRPTAISQPPPAWTRLENHQCRHCPLKPADHPLCPVAANLAGVIAEFKDCFSHEEADVTIRTEARNYHRRVAVQGGISSLMGIVMVTSGCPIMDKLRPMVATHLPFATLDETLVRAVSTYLLAQYFRHRRGLTPDWELSGLAAVYDDVATLNRCFRERLGTIEMLDANFNALVHLDCFAIFGSMSVDGGLDDVEQAFRAYLGETSAGFPRPG